MQSIGNIVGRDSIYPKEPRFEDRTCEKHGVYSSRFIMNRVWSECPGCRDERVQREKEESQRKEAEYKEMRMVEALTESGISVRFQDRKFDNYVADTPQKQRALEFAKAYAEGFDEVRKSGRNAVFLGGVGTGKTHLASAIAQHVVRHHGGSVRFVTVMRAMRAIKSSWSKESEESESEMIRALTGPSLLVLDEVGVQFGSEFEKNTLFDVLNHRYENRKPTIFLSNLTKDELAAFLGECVMDRLREDGGAVIPFSWDSYRGKAGK